MNPTPMTSYTTANSARVMPPLAAPKPALYAARLAELVAQGLTAADAMHRIERGDKHRALLPPSMTDMQRGKPKPVSAQRKFALAALTAEFADAIPVVSAGLGIGVPAARALLRRLVIDGAAVSANVGPSGRMFWRLA